MKTYQHFIDVWGEAIYKAMNELHVILVDMLLDY